MREPFYITERETARLIGKGVEWLRKHGPMLEETTGFPPIDPVLKGRNLQDLIEWQAKRAKQIRKETNGQSNQPTERGNAHAF